VLAWRRSLRLLGGTLVAPHETFAALGDEPPVSASLVLLGLASSALLLLQAASLEPVLQADPLVADLPAARDAAVHSLRWIRVVLALLAPLGLALRCVALAAALAALREIAGGRGSWKRDLGLVVHLESIFLLESLCLTLLILVARPESFTAARELRLRAGLDLFVQPESPLLAAALSAVNVFVVWWGVLLVRGVARLAGIPGRSATLVAAPVWLAAVALRFFLQSR
jgi:Yip1-like protein